MAGARSKRAAKALAFFHAAGLPAARDSDGLRVGALTIPLPSSTSAAVWSEWIDEIASEHYGHQLLESIALGLGAIGRDLRAVPGTRGLRLVNDERLPVAVVRATHAKVKGQPMIRGNFLTAGKHWERLRADIELSRKERAKGRPVIPGQGKAARKRAAQLERVRTAVEAHPDASVEELCSATGLGERNVVKLLAVLESESGSPTEGRTGYGLGAREEEEAEFAEIDLEQGQEGEPEFRLDTLADVAAVLAAAGIEAVADGEQLTVAGHELRPPASTVEDRQALRRWTDALVAERFPEMLTVRARAELPVPGAVHALANGELAIRGRRRGTIATITATTASGDRFEPIEGNYLLPGVHWRRLTAQIEPELPARGDYVDEGLHREFPEGADAGLAEAALHASWRLQEERARAFDNELRVDMSQQSLVFAPLRPISSSASLFVTRPVVELPFTFEREGERFAGALRLQSLPGLLPCEWHQPSDAETLALAWSLSLAAYAELTCFPEEREREHSPRPSASQRRRRASRAGQPPQASQPRTRRLGIRNAQALPSGFRPQGQTTRYMASWVSGHIRQLQEGQTHSEEAAANAAALGITLRAGETWVRPHSRGLPPDAVLHFSWSGPEWLKETDG